jgi:hypothetical protein
MNSSVKIAAPNPVATMVRVLTLNKSFMAAPPLTQQLFE